MNFRNITVFGKALRSWLGCLFQSWKRTFSSDHSLRDLLRYDDHLLKDIGVTREQIMDWLKEPPRKRWAECLRDARICSARTRQARQIRKRNVSCET